tara:strand:+ start:474 stop:743 length:270 start_codon:yes stop_codon:yes gene_type:complete
MNTNELIFGQKNVKNIFANNKRVDEILITTDAEAFNMTEGFDTDSLDWVEVIDFGVVAFEDVTAVNIRWTDVEDVETIINKNGSWANKI